MATQLPQIIGLVGPIRAGKTTVSHYLAERYGYTIASNSDLLREILNKISVPPSRDNLGALGNSLFHIFGNDLIARYRLENLHLGRIVVDGIRYSEELELYRENTQFRLLGISACAGNRFLRALEGSHEMKDVELTREKFDGLALSRSELDVPELLDQADRIIVNNSSKSQLLLQIDQVITDWAT
ncbi:hypothetical protein GIB23_15630 [Pseudomonas putida]|uniref:AAA family ATPase n=1 Tax=Pseudomonas putida TaxID=303 RepID=UPI001A90B1BC|nr:AAA family ATPase [Pseudomonas putida]MBO0368517.1 hypothetical protein [Pseudomonas putida]